MTNSLRFGSALTAILFAVVFLFPGVSTASQGEELDPVGHSADGYYLDFSPGPKVQLPRIFLIRDGQGSLKLNFFWSSAAAVEKGGYHAEWADAAHGASDDNGELLAEELLGEVQGSGHGGTQDAQDAADSQDVHAGDAALEARHDYYYATLTPPGGGHVVVDLSITRHLFFAWLGMLIVALAFISMGRRYTRGVGRDTAPRGRTQNLLETLVLFVRDDIARPNLGDKTDRYLPYLLTAFFFILTCNLLGLVPFGATATSNIMVTAVLATITFVLTQLGGSRDHWAHVFNPPGVPNAVKPILIPVEILGLFTKPFALAIRLFANMTAGHLVILSLIGLIFTFSNLFGSAAGFSVAPVSVAFALFIYLLELLVSFIQAYVFTMLSALFIGMAVAEHDQHEHDHDEEYVTPALAEMHDTIVETTTGEPELATAR